MKHVTTPKCPMCGTIEETQTHTLQCNSRRAKQNRAKTLYGMAEKMTRTTKTPIQINHLITKIIHYWCEGRDVETIKQTLPNNTTGEPIRQAFNEQEILGWTAFMRGYWAKKWETILPTKMTNNQRTKWVSQWISQIFQIVDKCWEARNKCAHSDESKVAKQIQQETDKQIREAYDTKHIHLSSDMALYSTPLEKRLQHPIEDQTRWLDQVKTIRKMNAPQDGRQTTLHTYFRNTTQQETRNIGRHTRVNEPEYRDRDNPEAREVTPE